MICHLESYTIYETTTIIELGKIQSTSPFTECPPQKKRKKKKEEDGQPKLTKFDQVY